jgi:hypothetical protein
LSQQVELEKTRITSALTSQFSQELQKERAGRERVSADLRALLAFEITAKHRFEEDLDKVKFESAESQKQLCKLQNAFDPLSATQSRKLAEAMLEQIKPAIREVNHIQAQVAGLETSHSELQRQYDEASLSSEAMRYQLAISRTAWQDAENERIDAEKRSAELKLCHSVYLEEKDVMESLRASLKESLEDALLFETLYQRSQQQLLKLQEERSRVRDKAMQLYSNRDYTQAKPIIEQLLEMDPADEEALHCYKIILEEETEKTQHQQRVLQQASQYTVQILEQAYQLAPENNNDSLSAIIRQEQRQQSAPVILENACQGYERALKLLELAAGSSCEDRGEQNAEYLRRARLQDFAATSVQSGQELHCIQRSTSDHNALAALSNYGDSGVRRLSECTQAHEASESQQRAAHERRTLAIARLELQDSLLLLARQDELMHRRARPKAKAADPVVDGAKFHSILRKQLPAQLLYATVFDPTWQVLVFVLLCHYVKQVN